MIAREEVFKEISRLHDSFLASHVRKEAIVDYVMRLVGQEAGGLTPAAPDVASDEPFPKCDACGEVWIDHVCP